MIKPVARAGRNLEQRTLPVQQRGTRTLDAILEAAHNILKTEGIDGLSTQSVARQSRVAVGTVYRLFPNKEAIVCKVYEDKIATVRAMGEETRLAVRPDDDWRAALTAYIRALKAAEQSVDFDQSLANAVILIPEIQRLDVLHAIDLAQRLVEMLLMLGAKWSDAALFDLAMTLYCLEGASWQYARTCGAANATLSERLLTCALTLVEPAMRGDPEPAGHGMDRDRLLAEYALTRA